MRLTATATLLALATGCGFIAADDNDERIYQEGYDDGYTAASEELSQTIEELQTSLEALQTQVDDHESRLDDLEGGDTGDSDLGERIDALETASAELASVVAVSSGDLVVTGNLRVVNGSESTHGTGDGSGNLIVGYATESSISGSHNVVLGDGHSVSGTGGFVGGDGNTIASQGASVIAGSGSASLGVNAVVLGGTGNSASGEDSVITAGSGNDVTDDGDYLP